MCTSTPTTRPDKTAAERRPSVFSVTALTTSIKKNLLANNEKLKGVWIEGEISGNKVYASGHRYFTLKDDKAAISCVLFAFHLDGCAPDFKAKLAQGEEAVNGLKVQIQGELDLNMGRGQYAFKVGRLRLSGVGGKMAEFNALKAKIEAVGWNKLDHPELRRSLPFLPHRIGIVTSPAGAVIHDMCDVLLRRFPNLQIRLFPVKVQGDGAAKAIASGIAFFQRTDTDWQPDVLIVGRGGGSMEDLWPFNEREVVDAVAHSRIPVISAVGHESDTTLCDYVADLRAGTPSIAAERVVPVKDALSAQVDDAANRLRTALRQKVESLIQNLDYLSEKLARSPLERLNRLEMRLHMAVVRLAQVPRQALLAAETRLKGPAVKLEPLVRQAVLKAEAAVREQTVKLELLNPYAVLDRGYSITMDAEGRVVRKAADVAAGSRLVTRLADGTIESTVVSR